MTSVHTIFCKVVTCLHEQAGSNLQIIERTGCNKDSIRRIMKMLHEYKLVYISSWVFAERGPMAPVWAVQYAPSEMLDVEQPVRPKKPPAPKKPKIKMPKPPAPKVVKAPKPRVSRAKPPRVRMNTLPANSIFNVGAERPVMNVAAIACGHTNVSVMRTEALPGLVTRKRLACMACGERFTTWNDSRVQPPGKAANPNEPRIRELLDTGMSGRRVAEELGVTIHVVNHVQDKRLKEKRAAEATREQAA